jgi:hypothetical protein
MGENESCRLEEPVVFCPPGLIAARSRYVSLHKQLVEARVELAGKREEARLLAKEERALLADVNLLECLLKDLRQ